MSQTKKGTERKIGRPRREDRASIRRKQINTKWSLDEERELRSNAALAGLSVGEYVRKRCLGVPVVARVSKADHRLAHELNRIGVNLNILLRDVLSERRDHDESEWASVRHQLHEALDRVLEDLDD